MKEINDCLSLPLIALDTSEEIGVLTHFITDPVENRIIGFGLTTGEWYAERKAILFGDVSAFGVDAVIVRAANAVQPITQLSEIQAYINEDREKRIRQAISASGQSLGTLTDWSFDERSADVIQFRLERADGGEAVTVPRNAFVRSGKAVVILDSTTLPSNGNGGSGAPSGGASTYGGGTAAGSYDGGGRTAAPSAPSPAATVAPAPTASAAAPPAPAPTYTPPPAPSTPAPSAPAAAYTPATDRPSATTVETDRSGGGIAPAAGMNGVSSASAIEPAEEDEEAAPVATAEVESTYTPLTQERDTAPLVEDEAEEEPVSALTAPDVVTQETEEEDYTFTSQAGLGAVSPSLDAGAEEVTVTPAEEEQEDETPDAVGVGTAAPTDYARTENTYTPYTPEPEVEEEPALEEAALELPDEAPVAGRGAAPEVDQPVAEQLKEAINRNKEGIIPFVVGKYSDRDIMDDDGNRIIAQGQQITLDIASAASRSWKLYDLWIAAQTSPAGED